MARHVPHLCVLPPYLLHKIAENGDRPEKEAALETLSQDVILRATRKHPAPALDNVVEQTKAIGGRVNRRIFDCAHGQSTSQATLVRAEGQSASSDVDANEAYDGLGSTYDLYWNAFGRNSIDGNGMTLDGYVHYGHKYDNAFWDGAEMIFGDGDGTTFRRFTISVDVIGHELTHGVTAHEVDLVYEKQSGALNESISDCFGSMVKQYALGQTAEEADWLIGAGLLTGRHDVALRSMKSPGSAYDDPVLGKDPQPAHMDDYVETTDDSGGVHLNSGIPNRAFYLAAAGIGGKSWEGAGKVWYSTICDRDLSQRADFVAFAEATVTHAETLFGAGSTEARAVREAWTQVGVSKG